MKLGSNVAELTGAQTWPRTDNNAVSRTSGRVGDQDCTAGIESGFLNASQFK